MKTGDSDWPLPSQSYHLRILLYLAEGMIIAGGATIFLLQVFIPTLDTLLDLTNGDILLVILAFSIMFFLISRPLLPVMDTGWDADWPPEYQDWGEIRRWRKVAIIALGITAIHLGVLVLLWRWWSILSFGETYFASVGMVLSGFLLHLYVFHRIGVTQ